MIRRLSALSAAATTMLLSGGATAQVTVTVENLSPSSGTFVTPVWFGFHDGSFDLFNVSAAASVELERLAEDGNIDPRAFRIFDSSGNFIPQSFVIAGDFVFDAGTEVNDELPANTAFFGQMSPNTGASQGGEVDFHPGFLGSFRNPGGMQSILGDPMFAGADFSAPNYQVLRVTLVPGPGVMAVLGVGGLVAVRRRRVSPEQQGSTTVATP